jgi:hypothetical protein
MPLLPPIILYPYPLNISHHEKLNILSLVKDQSISREFTGVDDNVYLVSTSISVLGQEYHFRFAFASTMSS